MSHDLDSMENTLLDELASTVEAIRSADLQIRESVESARWDKACRFSAALVQLLMQRRATGDALNQKLIDLGHTNTEQAVQLQRCFNMSMHLLGLLSKHLPIYQRMLAGLAEKKSDRQALPG